MVRFFVSLAMAVSMFSVIPVPRFEWKKENMTFMLANLPFVGLIIFGASALWQYISESLGSGTIFHSAILTAIPLLVSGGIHMDGYLDTHDAIASYGDKEKRREILKDPHIGTFAVVWAIMYVLLFFGAVSEIDWNMDKTIIFGMTAVISRAIGAFCTLNIHSYGNGFSAMMSSAADKSISNVIVLIYFAASVGIVAVFDPALSVLMLIVSVISVLVLRGMAYKYFGGMSGDLAGYVIQMSSLLLMISWAIFEKAGVSVI